jgi:glucose-1-phosphate thymidylyltransferase
MYPLTKDRAKPLLPVAGKPIVEHLVDHLAATDAFSEMLIVANARFNDQFVAWAKPLKEKPIVVLNDGAVSEQTRLGAVRDLAWVVSKRGLRGPLLVAAGDNLFHDTLPAFIADYVTNPRNLVVRYRETDPEKLKRTGVAELGNDGRLVRLMEKPQRPATEWACPALYIFEDDALDELDPYLTENSQADALGGFIAWLAPRVCVFTHEMQGSRLDVGDLEGYARAESWAESKMDNGV